MINWVGWGGGHHTHCISPIDGREREICAVSAEEYQYSISCAYFAGGCRILDEAGSRQVGLVTSGCPSPSLKKNVAIGYAQTEVSASGQRLKLEVRREKVDAEVVKLPFVPTKYFSVK